MSKEQLIFISKETLRYILTLLFAAIGAYIGMDRFIHDMKMILIM